MRTMLALALALVGGCKRSSAHAPTDVIPRSTAKIAIDGEWDEADWAKRALRGQLRGLDGELARPSSEIRLLRDDADLIVALYAADENIESRDAFDLTVGSLALHVTAAGAVVPPVIGVRAAAGYDEGTIDKPTDDDEEWVVELAIPLAATGLHAGEHTQIRAARCDVPKDGVERCGSWSGSLTIE